MWFRGCGGFAYFEVCFVVEFPGFAICRLGYLVIGCGLGLLRVVVGPWRRLGFRGLVVLVCAFGFGLVCVVWVLFMVVLSGF